MDSERTKLLLSELSSAERIAVTELRKRALSSRWGQKPWCEPEKFAPVSELPAATTPNREVAIDLDAPLETVRTFLAKALKPGRVLLDAVRFSDGRIEEYKIAATEKPKEKAEAEAKEDKPKEKEKPKDEPKAGATVAKPTVGCPRPDFDPADVRATRVLKTFLTPEQLEDFEKTQRFICIGSDTGHRYILSSRPRTGQYGRSVYDLEERRPFCVHDYTVPPSEELLALNLFLSLPGRESYVRSIPE
jgi:hypothetical protein